MTKKIVLIATLSLIFLGNAFWGLAEEIKIEIETSTQTYQWLGGTGQEITRVLSNHPAHGDTDFLHPPRVLFVPGEKPQIWFTTPIYDVDEDLYTLEEAEKLIEKSGDLVQYTGKPKYIEKNNDPIHLLPNMPDMYVKQLWGVMAEAIRNAWVDETIKRLLSYIKGVTNTRRVLVQVGPQYLSVNAGNALGGNLSGSELGVDTAIAAAIQARLGKGEARKFDLYRVIIYAFDDCPLTTRSQVMRARSIKPEEKRPEAEKIAFRVIPVDKKGNLNLQVISKNVDLITKSWKNIRDKGQRVEFQSHFLGQNTQKMAEELAIKAMVLTGQSLYAQGVPEAELYNLMQYSAKMITEPKKIDFLRQRGNPGVIVLKLTTG